MLPIVIGRSIRNDIRIRRLILQRMVRQAILRALVLVGLTV